MPEPRARVLIVDDANLQRLYYRQTLEGAGFAVEEALNGLEALEKLLVKTSDLIIVDINMPRMDGLTFLEALRKQSLPLSSIPAIIITTESRESDVEAARAAGANLFLVKPVQGDILTEYVAMFCGLPDE
jgi:two-component system chemotaxis response regulator CheY